VQAFDYCDDFVPSALLLEDLYLGSAVVRGFLGLSFTRDWSRFFSLLIGFKGQCSELLGKTRVEFWAVLSNPSLTAIKAWTKLTVLTRKLTDTTVDYNHRLNSNGLSWFLRLLLNSNWGFDLRSVLCHIL
jgi:hypothetical protein